MNALKLGSIVAIMKMAYASLLRDALVRLVESTDNDIDDYVVEILDKLFDYEPG